MRSEERRNICLDFERRFWAAVRMTMINIVSALSDEALDFVVARRDWNAHDFRELSVCHENVEKSVNDRKRNLTMCSMSDSFNVR